MSLSKKSKMLPVHLAQRKRKDNIVIANIQSYHYVVYIDV